MKSVAVVSLALAGSALARSTIHHEIRQPVQVLNADNELHNYYSMPGNQGNIQFNDYSKTHDDELWGVGVNIKSEVNNFPHNSGNIVISHDDQADNELHNYYTMPRNQGNIQFNDYTVQRDATDDELWGVDVNLKSEVNNFPHNSGNIRISHDDQADNELHKYFSMPGNQGEIQFNDYTVKRDATDNELRGIGVDVNLKSEVNNFPRNSGNIRISHDDEADNELHNYYSMPGNEGNIQFNDYTVKRDATDDELWGVDVKVKSEVNNFPHNSGNIRISHDDEADNELHNYYSMPGNQGNIQFNDYSKTHDDELWGVDIDVKSEVNNFPYNSGTIVISHDDEADNELHNYYSMSGNQGNIQFNDYTKTHDDELFLGVNIGVKSEVNNFPHNSGTIVISHDDEFVAHHVEKLTKDEIEVLATLLKVATQDKNGNVVVDGVKIGKIPKQEAKKIETPKPKKFLAL